MEVFNILKQAILRKDSKWSYEAEWRKRAQLSKPRIYDPYIFPKEIINDIICCICMGANIYQEHKKYCHEFSQRHNTALYQIKLSDCDVEMKTVSL